MSVTVINCAQGSPTWLMARMGRVTGSMAHCVTARGKGCEAVTRRDYRFHLACERITGQPEPSDFQNADMRRGNFLEPRAIEHYEAVTGLTVERTGFLQDDHDMIGCSLDGHCGDRFQLILEFKACKPALHLRHWKERDSFVRQHWQQIAHNIWVSGAETCELISYNELVPPKLRLLRISVGRRDCNVDEYVACAERFLADVKATESEIRALAERLP